MPRRPSSPPCPDGRGQVLTGWCIAVQDNGRASIWDIETGQCLTVLADDHEAGISSASLRDMIGFSPDGSLVVTVAGGTRVWGVATGEAIATLAGLPGGGYATFLPDGSYQAADPGDSLWWAAGLPCCPPGELDLRRTGKRLE